MPSAAAHQSIHEKREESVTKVRGHLEVPQGGVSGARAAEEGCSGGVSMGTSTEIATGNDSPSSVGGREGQGADDESQGGTSGNRSIEFLTKALQSGDPEVRKAAETTLRSRMGL